MGPRALDPLLLLSGLLLISGRCGAASSLYTIDAVGLAVLPAPTVASGTSVTLTCSVSVSHAPALRLSHAFLFTRYDAVVHAANGSAPSARYRLGPARAAHSGDYECRVEVMEKVRHSGVQRLTVTGLQTPVLTLSADQVYEGEELAASCSAPQEAGSLVFQFYQRAAAGGGAGGGGGAPVLLKQTFSPGNRAETRLAPRDPGAWELFCNYSIPMATHAGSSGSSNTLRLLVKGLFISPVMNVLPSSSVFEGEVVEVVCRVVAPPGPVDLYLTRGRRVLRRGGAGLSHRLVVGLADAGEYVCKAEYGTAQKETYQSLRVKEVFSRPLLSLEPLQVFEGEELELVCAVQSYSRERLDLEDLRFSVYRDQQLLVRGPVYRAAALPPHNGNYTCRAEADGPERPLVKESPPLLVQVRVPVSEPVLSVVGGRLVVGRPFALRCRSDSGSLPITYELHGPRRPAQTREVLWEEEGGEGGGGGGGGGGGAGPCSTPRPCCGPPTCWPSSATPTTTRWPPPGPAAPRTCSAPPRS